MRLFILFSLSSHRKGRRALPQHPVKDGHVPGSQRTADATVKFGEIDALDPVVVVKVLGPHLPAVQGSHSDAMILVLDTGRAKVVDFDSVDRFDGEVVLGKVIRSCVMENVRLLAEVLRSIALDVSDGRCDCV